MTKRWETTLDAEYWMLDSRFYHYLLPGYPIPRMPLTIYHLTFYRIHRIPCPPIYDKLKAHKLGQPSCPGRIFSADLPLIWLLLFVLTFLTSNDVLGPTYSPGI